MDSEAEQQVRSARAEVARLGLELRVAQRAGTEPDDGFGATAEATPRDALSATLQTRIARRRAEQAAELQHARDAAAALVVAARTDAAVLVAAASAETAELLVGRAFVARPVVPSTWATVPSVAGAVPFGMTGWTNGPTMARPAVVPSVPVAEPERRRFWSNVAYADVVLPLVAVLLVLVVLFAWVG